MNPGPKKHVVNLSTNCSVFTAMNAEQKNTPKRGKERRSLSLLMLSKTPQIGSINTKERRSLLMLSKTPQIGSINTKERL